jgi:hypothetical protein
VNAKLIALASAAMLLAGCAALAPIDELTWSSGLAASLPLEDADIIEAAGFSALSPTRAYLGGWQQFEVLRGNVPTDYQLVERDGVVVLQAESAQGGSGLFRKIHIDPRRNPIIEWRWRVPRDSGVGGNNGPSRASNVTVTDVIPAGMSYTSSSAPCTYNGGTNTVTITSRRERISVSFRASMSTSNATPAVCPVIWP